MQGYFAPYVQLQTPLRHSRHQHRATSTAVVEKLSFRCTASITEPHADGCPGASVRRGIRLDEQER